MIEQLKKTVLKQLGESVSRHEIAADGIFTITVESAFIVSVCQALCHDLKFEQLTDLSGVDYSTYGQCEWNDKGATSTGFSRGADRSSPSSFNPEKRFAVVYHLLSYQHNIRLRIKTFLPEDQPRIVSVTGVWPVADWYEREAFDLYGILFDGHPDLRRILTDYGFVGHPFRKDFPVMGEVEMRYDAIKGRIVYEPVEIPERTGVARVIREVVKTI